ncbi:hypothetical protein HYH02_012521 [Chlamydomonas schloesseri]|uniref:Thioredoxin domain-containing protein n=1 Tax=Chlamydomonas schloesseri TaxID=2026947 RepID=A0A835T6Y4_9CHLO|nr:hypothetical protein HYH02_012521 [Chlamydomonas schloesseri]|eukprot:KAG2433590.1 hypothetical protein HYH02_012521 [Chlamydomonas schloesseri]
MATLSTLPVTVGAGSPSLLQRRVVGSLARLTAPQRPRMATVLSAKVQASSASTSQPVYVASGPVALSSTTSSAAAGLGTDASLPGHFARVFVAAALALSTVYALLAAPTSNTAGSAFGGIAAAPAAAPPLAPDASPGTAAQPFVSDLAILRTPEQFDSFVVAANRAGYLAIVLFHAPWCNASSRMESELQRLSHMFSGRRVVFARVNCSVAIKQGGVGRLGQLPNPAAAASTNATAAGINSAHALQQAQHAQHAQLAAAAGGSPQPVQRLRLGLQRCDLTQMHRIHKTPTVRMYFNNACVDEVVGCRPVEFRQATSDLMFKYSL